MIIKNEFPILERSTENEAIINPWAIDKRREITGMVPRLCLVTFFEEVLNDVVHKYNAEIIGTYHSEMKDFNLYKMTYENTEICVVQSVVGAGSVAMMMDWLYGKGVEVIVACGACGVLDSIPSGDIIIPIRALRDEGASYKYLPPSRFIEFQKEPIDAFKQIMKKYDVPYIECTTWSTDGFYRETREMVEYRVSEGCKVVEMECATIAAVAQYRNKMYGQLLYSGDILINTDKYDDRDWKYNSSAREKLFYISLQALCLL